MTLDTSTAEGRQKRLDEIVESYKKSGNKIALVRNIGGSVENFGQKTGYEAGEPPKGAEWDLEEEALQNEPEHV